MTGPGDGVAGADDSIDRVGASSQARQRIGKDWGIEGGSQFGNGRGAFRARSWDQRL